MSLNSFEEFLNSISDKSLRVLDASISNSKYIPIDLSEMNKDFEIVDVSSHIPLGAYINSHIKSQNGLVAYGGYNEIRSIYKHSHHFNSQVEEERNIHLGIDLWSDVETPIYAPLDGAVHSFKNNTNYGDYGPTIILKHDIDNVVFFTLYGHLSVVSIQNLEVGKTYKQGELMATLGDATVNGNYPPHLHFQIIKDIKAYKGDYPGVSSKHDIEFYKVNCPDPDLLLKLGI